MRTVILSPHCDDAPLSLGAGLLERALGHQPDVCVIFSVSGYARGDRGSRSAVAVTALRKNEEQQAAHIASYTPRFWNLPEASVRCGLQRLRDVFNDEHDVEADVVWPDLIELMRALIAEGHDAMCLPLGCGDHVDHRIAREAAIRCCESTGQFSRLVFYEDLPYAGCLPLERIERQVQRVTRKAGSLELESVVFGSALVPSKLALLGCYPSQLGRRELALVAQHAARVQGERVWAHSMTAGLIRRHASYFPVKK